jgi:hypothetical protein
MGKEIKTYFKILSSSEKEVFRGQSKRVSISGEEDDYASYVETDIHMSVNKDGDIYVSDWTNGDSGVFIYSDQLEHLEDVLQVAFAQRRINLPLTNNKNVLSL